MSIKIALSGANGRMGKSIVKVASCNSEFDISVKLIKPDYENTKSNLPNILKTIDVFIDFSTTTACLEYLKICKQLKIPMVIGTTGFTVPQIKKISNVAKHIPIMLSPNMSVGANICQYLLACLSKLLEKNQQAKTTIVIKEVHHKNKRDSPSGTALRMADIIKNNFSYHNNIIKFVSNRIGQVKGRHQVNFSNKFEEISIKHNVKNRSVFAAGSLLAAKWLIKQKSNKLYNFLDIVNFKEILAKEILF